MATATISLPSQPTSFQGATAPCEPPPLPKWEKPPDTKEYADWADILTVNLSLYSSHKEVLVETVRTALQRDGFFYVVGHGIPLEKIERQFDIAKQAFDAVSLEEKLKHLAPIVEKGCYGGYKLVKMWELNHGVKDSIEHYDFNFLRDSASDAVARHPKALRPYVPEARGFMDELRQSVLRRITSLIDAVLDLPEGTLWDLHEGKGLKSTRDLFRYQMYNPLSKEEAKMTNGVMLNGHTDIGAITLLVSQPVAGLQVLMPDDVWRYVKYKEGSIVVNIGDQLSLKTGGILKGTMHRGEFISPPSDQVHLRRLGVFYFVDFAGHTPLDLFPSETVRERGRIMFQDHVPTAEEWRVIRTQSYGLAKFIKGEEYDVEIINGAELRHYH
ncbi:Clavaminate synthase-like protein [Fistulina hepatica ATCC 64428]|uniref:Clavaminate synthase-like protein n=1 Tax=Fistulina hepatica ATCC 64428 TaxID=1128425 RepID=A0A0D7AGP1_9AGAR|nr:Clavaminate synthase-like protein [Fistulina hepatica ATCC 64428]